MRRQSLLLSLLAAVGGAGVLTPLHTTVVRGESMAPTLQPGGLYVLDVGHYRRHPVERGQVILFRYQGQSCIKRVRAVAGDRLFLLRHLDGGPDEIVTPPVAERLRRLQQEGRLVGRRLSELTVPPGHIYVVGDNEDVSWDSRSFGCLPGEAVIGRVMR